MEKADWRKIDEKHLEAYHRRVALAETLLDEAIDEAERQQVRCRYIEEYEVSERTIRNYLRRYRTTFRSLYFDIINNGIPHFITQLNNLDRNIQLESNKEWDIGFEVCFYRDLLYCYGNKEKPIRVVNEKREKEGLPKFPEKRTFDLCLFSEDEILIIEAKAQQGLESEQCDTFKNDVENIKELFSEIDIPMSPEIKLVLIASSNYLKSPSFKRENGIGKRFIEENRDLVSGRVSWKSISTITEYSYNKEIYERADNSYKH